MGVEGYENFKACLDRLEIESKNAKWLNQATRLVENEAKQRCPVNFGALSNSIQSTIEKREGSTYGVVGTSESYAPFVEFGTGTKGAENHAGISPYVDVSYGSAPWYIPVEKVHGAEKYPLWKRVKNKEGQEFFVSYGQPAHPFLYPALKDNKEKIIELARNSVKKALRSK